MTAATKITTANKIIISLSINDLLIKFFTVINILLNYYVRPHEVCLLGTQYKLINKITNFLFIILKIFNFVN